VTATATEAALRDRTRLAFADPTRNAEAARAALRKRLDDSRSRIGRSLAVVAVIVGLQAMSGGLESALVIGGMAAVIVAVGLFAVVLPRRRRALAAGSIEGDLLAWLRADLDREIGGLRRTRPYLTALGVLAALLLLLTVANLAKDLWLVPKPIVPAHYFVPLVIMALVGFQLWYDVRHRLPWLEREREDLS
jgi:hypothetical protein